GTSPNRRRRSPSSKASARPTSAPTASEGTGVDMRILGFNRVELIVGEDEIDRAIAQFNEVLGLRLPKPHTIEGRPMLSATDFDGSIEFVAPVGGEGNFGAKLALGPGQLGP